MRTPLTVSVPLLLTAFALALPAVAFADWQERLRITIPFGFTVDDTSLPAGDYRFYTSSAEPNALRVDHADGELGVLTLTHPLSPAESRRDPMGDYMLVFEKLEGRRFLEEIHLISTDSHWLVNKGKDYTDLKLDGRVGTYHTLPPSEDE